MFDEELRQELVVVQTFLQLSYEEADGDIKVMLLVST